MWSLLSEHKKYSNMDKKGRKMKNRAFRHFYSYFNKTEKAMKFQKPFHLLFYDLIN